MAIRIYISPIIADARAKIKKRQFEALGIKNKLGAVRLANCYTVDAKLDAKQILKSVKLLHNPLMEEVFSDADKSARPGTVRYGARYNPGRFDYAIEIGYLPGVTDNVGSTARETLEDGLKGVSRTGARRATGTGIKFKPGQNVYSSQVFFISFNTPTTPSRSAGHPSLKRRGISADIQKIAGSLYNPLIQRATIKSFEDFKKDGGLDIIIPKVKLTSATKVTNVNLDVSDEELTKLGKLGIADKQGNRQGPLSLSLD